MLLLALAHHQTVNFLHFPPFRPSSTIQRRIKWQ